MDPIVVGQQIRCACEFGTTSDPDTRVLVDPTVVKFKVRDPNWIQRTFVFGVDTNVVRDGVGLYHADVTLTESTAPGKRWAFRWVGTGALVTAAEVSIDVELSAFDKPL